MNETLVIAGMVQPLTNYLLLINLIKNITILLGKTLSEG